MRNSLLANDSNALYITADGATLRIVETFLPLKEITIYSVVLWGGKPICILVRGKPGLGQRPQLDQNKSRTGKMTVLFDVAPVEGALDTLLAYTFPDVNLTPIIRVQNAAARASRADELNAMLGDIDDTCSAVARLEARLQELFLRLRLRRTAVSMAMAPVMGLPTELLREIFVHVAESDRTSKARIVLSHVSSSWREASIGLQELWTIIQVPSRHPDMAHEFARRSGDLRFELSTLWRWPVDFELDRSEASRLAVLVFTSTCTPTHPLLSSAEKFKDLINLSKFVVAANLLRNGAMSAYMLNCRAIQINGPHIPLYWNPPYQLNQLVSLTLKRTIIEEVTELLSHLDVPLLREVNFNDVDNTYEPDTGSEDNSDIEDDIDGLAEINFSGLEKQITCLSIAWCSREVLWQMCDNLVMPSLTSLSIYVGTDRAIIDTLERLSHLLSTSPQLEYLNLSVGLISLRWLGSLWRGGLVPRLRTFCLLNPIDMKVGDDKHPEAELLLRVMVSRRKEFGVEPLQRLIVSRSFVRETDKEELREAVGELVFSDL